MARCTHGRRMGTHGLCACAERVLAAHAPPARVQERTQTQLLAGAMHPLHGSHYHHRDEGRVAQYRDLVAAAGVAAAGDAAKRRARQAKRLEKHMQVGASKYAALRCTSPRDRRAKPVSSVTRQFRRGEDCTWWVFSRGRSWQISVFSVRALNNLRVHLPLCLPLQKPAPACRPLHLPLQLSLQQPALASAIATCPCI
jgi:hypothetical protein